jgi:hypothetical protein
MRKRKERHALQGRSMVVAYGEVHFVSSLIDDGGAEQEMINGRDRFIRNCGKEANYVSAFLVLYPARDGQIERVLRLDGRLRLFVSLSR